MPITQAYFDTFLLSLHPPHSFSIVPIDQSYRFSLSADRLVGQVNYIQSGDYPHLLRPHVWVAQALDSPLLSKRYIMLWFGHEAPAYGCKPH